MGDEQAARKSQAADDLSPDIQADDPFADLPDFAAGLDEQLAAAAASTSHSPEAGVNSQSAASAAPPIAANVSAVPDRSNLSPSDTEVPDAMENGAALSEKSSPDASDASTTPEADPRRRRLSERLMMRSVPSWMISMMLHVAILMLLAAIQIEPVQDAVGVLLTATAGEDLSGLDEQFDIRGPELEAPAATGPMDQALVAPPEFSPQELAFSDSNVFSSLTTDVEAGSFSNMVESILPSSALGASASRISSSLSGRASGALKSEMLERFGGNAASEKSVAMALKWIADHQDRSGGWTFGHSRICRGQCKDDGDLPQATNAATALALLPFLGAGQTHLEGSYKATVHNGLKFLINRMKVTGGTLPHGSWHEDGGRMYSHGLAAIVVCEAYAMTRDPDLLQPAQLALNYIVYAQDPRGGGWRYEPKQAGDTSVVGWQLMALKSGVMGNLAVPPETFRRASSFLDAMSVNDGAYYGYDVPTSKIEGRQATTAVGLLCRMYLGWSKDNPGLKEGVQFLSKRGPSVEDLYYSYYATQVLRQFGGEPWDKWNKAMRDGLIKAQETEGHAAGSWYSGKGHNERGGRLYCTAVSAMILEVYYRHLPLYTEKSSDEEFEF